MRKPTVGIAIVMAIGCGASTTEHRTPAPPTVPTVAAPPTAPAAPVDPLAAAIRPVTDTYHGVTVADPYRWLEDDSDEAKAWSAHQNEAARAVLDHLPDLAKLRDELRAILDAPITTYFGLEIAGGRLFALRKRPNHEQPELIVMTDPAKPEAAKLIFDPAGGGDAQRALDWWRPSPDGKRIAISLSEGGSEAGSLHVIDLDGKDLEPVIPNVQRGTGGGDAAWTPDGKAIYYTRYPSPGEKPAAELDGWLTVWIHQLGTTIARDHQELGGDLPKIAEIQLASDRRGRVIASVQDGDGGTFRHYLRDAAGWRQLDDWDDHIVAVEFGAGDNLWAISRDHAPHGKLLKVGAHAGHSRDGTVVVPEGSDALVTSFESHHNTLTTDGRVFMVYQLGGPSALRAFTLDGKPAESPPSPAIGTVEMPVAWGGGIIYDDTSYTTDWTYHFYVPARHTATVLAAMSPKRPVDLSAFTVTRELATSRDGTKIPLNIVWPNGAPKDGSTPCLVTGYGGFGVNISPHFLSGMSPLLTRGVCFVEVNLRGGGELGEDWHRAGMLVNKQNVFDDFTAAIHFVTANYYSSTPRLAIMGGSNGGLLMGAMITQHPELVHAVVSEVGLYDMVRSELSPNGAYIKTEYGTVADPDQFAALYAYSPYHHVRPGAYPAILMTTGANDPRVSPWHSRKMIAALRAAQTGTAPILLRTSDKAGHGMGSSVSERVALAADVQAFLLAQLQPGR